MIMRNSIIITSVLLLAGCAIGPSTRVTPPTYPVTAERDSVMSPGTRALLDSLTRARESGAEPSGVVIEGPVAARQADST
jgi:hypothetical protein